ncbi:unnamed protein product [Owenia fusiformis]|uniref:Uncharacterized protein n=1 Tax=Owenia fusiformis TaxID=6347 RepID=A0A8J1XSX0_OWEFU|nr:unnamed protein product [Owenia fusiformis]
MPLGPFGEVVGTTNSLAHLGAAANYESKVIAPRNPKLMKGDQEDVQMTPSVFMFQMSMDTEKKLANTHEMRLPKKIEFLDMADTTHQKFSQVSVDEPMFQPYPSEIYFQNYTPFETYEVPLLLRNSDKVPRLVKVTQADSPYFKIISPPNVGHKVGPGLPSVFKIQFVPEEKKDYIHELVVITEREKFIVPVKCIGARALLDFPDDINFAVCPVKHASTKTLLVRNVGNREAKFALTAEGEFTVSPENGILPENESMQVTVTFTPTYVGNHNEKLVLHYDTGEDIYIDLYGGAQDVNVRLDKNSLKIENTFLSMANQRTVTISNRSDVIAYFKWSQFATQLEEDSQRSRFCNNISQDESNERDRFLEECISDPSLRDKMSILSRTFQNRRKIVEDDKMTFSDDVIKIDPVEGEIWPNSNLEVTVIFKPDEAKTYTRTAYCDIVGRETRLPLRIKGDGIGPKVQFSFDSLDMGNIFISSSHAYEVVLANKGDIDAMFSLLPNNSVFGPRFSFNPSEGIVMPDGHQAIQVTFNSPILGDFSEDFYFQIDGSPEKLKLTFSGSVIGPTFQFDKPKLDFKMVSYGFISGLTCTLQNTSLVPMTFHLRVPGDGVNESIASNSDYGSTFSDTGSMLSPKEFTITPDHGSLEPQSSMRIIVELCSNSVKKYDLALVVDVDGVGDEVLQLPIVGRCIVPPITVITPLLDYGRCFLKHPYQQNVKLHNSSDLPAKYELLPQQIDSSTPILYNSPLAKGIIEPHLVLEVPLVITPQHLEELGVTAYFGIFGSSEAPLPVHLSCIGEGPVVHVMPLNLDWGQIPVLTEVSKTLLLSNESLIPAKFTSHMVRPNSVWNVEPRDGEIPPEETMELTVTANLDDCVRFQDKLQVNFLDSQARTIPVTAYGYGTTIVSDPPMDVYLNLGPHFSANPCKKTFLLTNKGRRHQQLVWTTDGFSMVRNKKDTVPVNMKDMRVRDAPPPQILKTPVFKLTPQRFDLPPGKSVTVELEGQVDMPQTVKERMLCHAIIGRAGGKELIKKVDISVEFISPLVEFSTKNLFFRVDKLPEDTLELQRRDLEMTNISSLPLSLRLQLKYPFSLVDQDGMATTNEMLVSMKEGDVRTVTIEFDPAYKSDAHIRTIDEVLNVTYDEHPHVDYIALRGEVYFPNLEFEKMDVHFGCILNDTEVTRYVNITNNSPMEVNYKWCFLVGDEPSTMFNRPQPEPTQVLDVEAEHDDIQPEEKVEIEIRDEEEADEGLGQDIKEDEVNGDHNMSDEEREKMDTEKIDSGDEEEKKEMLIMEPANEEKDIFAEDQDLSEQRIVISRASTAADPNRPGTAASKAPTTVNSVLQALMEPDPNQEPLGVEEVFDILPLYGTLKPGDTEQITLTFYGHADIWGLARALCEVEGGPTYELTLSGEASLVNYEFDCVDIDYGKQMFDQVAVAEVTLHNTGKVGFEFTALNMDPSMANKPMPGVPVMIPHTGYIEANASQTLTLKFLPGVPETFHKSFMVQVAHFEPDTINLYGEGVFPRISLDLPRIGDEEGHYTSLMKDVRESLANEKEGKECERCDQLPSALSSQRDTHRSDDVKSGSCLHQENLPSELDIQMEVERMIVKEFAEDQQQNSSRSDVFQTIPQTSESRKSSSKPKKKLKPKPRLPDYLLDFGYVVLGTVRTHIVRATNTGWYPASFSVDHEYLWNSGFNVELNRVRQLPGAPDHETVDFVISFDPRGANLGLGDTETIVPINIVGGPQACIKLRANVTMPDMEISSDTLDFGNVNCGECKVITVQLHNHKHVKCEWNSIAEQKDKKKVDKHTPMHLRRTQKKQTNKPNTFEMMPAFGTLMPGQRINVQVKFMPTEETFYEQRIPLRLSQSSQRIMLMARGQGLEPRLDFERNLVEFGPILPHSSGDEQEIVVKNPCDFPIEFYSLEFDKQYLEEEKILRLMRGFDEYNTVLLPPRATGDKLPSELVDYYEEQIKKFEEAEKARIEAEEAAEQARKEQEEQEAAAAAAAAAEGEDDETTTTDQQSSVPVITTVAPSRQASTEPIKDKEGKLDKSMEKLDEKSRDALKVEDEDKLKESSSSVGVGELEITPVSAAIARHLGIDLSPEGKAARNRRGIAVIVHGAPMSGKTNTAIMLAKRYEAALLSINSLVTEAISSGSTPAGLRARELCQEAARKKAEEMRLLESDEGDKKVAGGLSVEAVAAHTQGQGGGVSGISAAHSVAHSVVSNRKTSTVGEPKGKDKHGLKGAAAAAASTLDGASSQVPSSPPPLMAPIARRLSVSASVAGEEGLMSCVLPEDLLVDLLADRIMLNDCHKGVVFDGLDTLFSQNMPSTLNAILRALNNRKYIYMLSLKLDYNTLKEKEKKDEEEKERQAIEKEEAERRRLEEMSEDEYDALTDGQKAEVDQKRLAIKKARIKKEMEEKMERERRDREIWEAEQRRLEEEKASKKKGRNKGNDPKDKKPDKGKTGAAQSADRMGTSLTSRGGPKPHDSDHQVGKAPSAYGDRPESHATESSELHVGDGKKKKKEGSKEGKRPVSHDATKDIPLPPEEPQKPEISEEERLLMQRFRTFEVTQKEICDIADFWDRMTLTLKRPITPSAGSELDDAHLTSGRKMKGKDHGKDKHDKDNKDRKDKAGKDKQNEHDKKDKLDKEAAPSQADTLDPDQDVSECPMKGKAESRDRLDDGIGINHLQLNCADEAAPGIRAIETGTLPSVEEVLDGLGLGPRGPPIPPPAEFQVVPYPVKRHAPQAAAESGHYIFVASHPDDPNIAREEKPKESEQEEEKSATPDGKGRDDHTTPTRGKGKDKLKAESKKDKRQSSAGKSKNIGRRSSASVMSPPPGAQTPVSDGDALSTITDNVGVAIVDSNNPKLGTFRWIVPANGECVLKLRFVSEELGQFDQTLNFEIMGTRRRYQLFCRGVCAFPTISREPRIVFPHRKKNKKSDEIVHKKYILTDETFDFGPLLVGKPRDRYKEGRYPENMEKLVVHNTSPLEADISFCFLSDSKAETYLLEPSNLILKPGEEGELLIWAYPKTPGRYEDSIVCCIRENPEPIIFNISCDGVRPELELDKKVLHFDKVLLHRKDTKTIYLRNSTLLPVAWKISGLENLGEDFSVSNDSGIIEAKSEFGLNAHFRALKAVTTNKKAIRLEVSDVEGIMGLVQTETIQVHAEAYDVALDMSFPKGADGGIDFGVIRVMDETKQQCTLKNKGRYDIAYSFTFEPCEGCPQEICDLFSVLPNKGVLTPIDRPTPVQVIFKSSKETTVKEMPILKCQVIEPNIGGGETIASIPVKITVRSVFNKYNIFPINDINFGSLLVNSKKTRTFTIENKGEFDFKYTITKRERKEDKEIRARPPVKGDKRSKSRDGSSSGRSVARPRRADSIRQDIGQGNQSRLVVGMFTIFPAFGLILPNGHQTVTVDCITEQPGRCDEELSVDITDRDPADHPQGIPYRLIAEACIPAISTADIGAIFEEHRVVKNLSVWQHGHQIESGGIFGEDENRFIFNNVIVGMKAKARFKVSNSNKVPCDVVFSIKPLHAKHASKIMEVFEVEPTRAQITAHGHQYATVTFMPASMQTFTANFEAAIDGVPQNQAKTRNLSFEVSGEGNLPRITIQKPTVRNKKGQPLLLYKRTLLGRKEALPLTLTNDGTLPCKVDIDLVDPDDVYTLRPLEGTMAVMADPDALTGETSRLPHTASVIVNVGDTANFEVIYGPTASVRSQGNIRLSVVNNQYEDSIVQIVGEGYEDDITLDNIHSIATTADPENQEGNNADDDVAAAKSNHIRFGDCYINEPRTLTFTMTNHSKTDCVRFLWPEQPQIKFAPQVGHLHAECTKDMSITFKTDAPKSLEELSVPCKITKITFDKPNNEIADWDDRMRTVKWVDVTPPVPATADSSMKPTTPLSQPGYSSVPPRPAKKKVIETEPEPSFQEIAESARTLDLLVSANADFCKYKVKSEPVKFKDTLMFQTRVYEMNLTNKGNISMDFNWQVVMEDFTMARSVTFANELERPESRAGSTTPSSLSSDNMYVPFSIEPENGTILSGKKQSFTVKFSPLDVNDYEARLLCSIPNLEEGKQGPAIALKARSLLPYCHFELEASDYLTSARRNPEMRGPNGAPPGTTLDPNTRVIEFKSVGVHVKNTRKFFIVNPTNAPYTFTWMNDDEIDPKHPPMFKCLTPEGSIRRGKKQEILFEFTPTELGITESFWKFVIPEHNISIPFLLMGDAREPNIAMDRSHFNFKSLLIGHEAMETVHIVNTEDSPLYFTFAEDSTHAAAFTAHLTVEPMTGCVMPKSKTPINLFFTPTSDKEVNFNLICNIKKKILPLTLNVKAEGYSMECMVLCEDSQGNKVELSDRGFNELSFGEVEVNEKAVRNIFIVNSGKFNFDFDWTLNERSTRKDKMVTITPEKGGVMFGERTKCALAFCPPAKTALRGCELILKISNGPTYVINVNGTGVAPGVHFSFYSYNFGPCFIYRAGMPKHSKTLLVTNKDKKEISLDCLYVPTAQLHHDFEALVLPPGQTKEVELSFYPREAIKYQETITFEINGLSKQNIEITGMGTEMKIEVANPKQKMVNFGALRVGQTVKKAVPIVNNSPAPISFHLAITPTNTVLQEKGVMTLTPTTEMTLEPRGGMAKVEMIFSPKTRVPKFTEEIMLECAGMFQPLFAVTGCCHGIEINLDTDAIPFGAVVQKSSSTRKLVMNNTGDIGARFKWDIAKFKPDFSIMPVEGYISPGMEVPFEVMFHPQIVSQDIRNENLKCKIEGGKALKLTLTGMCTSIPPVKEIQHFSTHVRMKETRNLMVMNRTNMHWHLRPIVDGEFYTGPDTFDVDPQQSKPYELTYKPLVMTTEGKKHQGTVFFPLPDGTGYLFNVSGTSEAPRAVSKLVRDIPCKTNYSEILPVNNWLKKPQRFRIKFEMIRPDKLDSGTTLKGLDYIDVPGNSKRDFKIHFYAHKEGSTQFKTVFTNETTGEYQYFELTFKATKPGVISTIDLSTPVRQSIQHTLTLKNPLSYAVTFLASCNVVEVLMPNQLAVPAESEGNFNIEYLPLKVGETPGRLEFTCNDLGLYSYDLNLKATVAGPERGLYFRTCLGVPQTHVAKFLNFAKQKTDYVCKLDNTDFHVDKTVAAAPGSTSGTEVAVEAVYEPSRLGESRGTLTVQSAVGGEYTFPLFGTCIAPKPQGPFTVKAGGTTSITFRNVFPHTTAFTFQVDNPLFHVTKPAENIRSRKDHRVVVGYDGNDSGSKAAVMGKLVVSCPRSAGGQSNVQWVYYLKGVTLEKEK